MDSLERILWWLFAGSAGADTRGRVLRAIREQPRNAQQLSQALDLDYTTVRHHLRVMEKNGLVTATGDRYGRLYFLSNAMESHWEIFEAIVQKTKQRGTRGAQP